VSQPLQALRRADQIEVAEGKVTRDWYAPIVADAEAGFGGPLNAYEMMKVCLHPCKQRAYQHSSAVRTCLL
jgi:isocitrate lyase